MKILKWALLIWSACASILVLLAFVGSKQSRTETFIFCAYGRLFVEFEESNKKWGTIMLDYDGKPIPCQEETELEKEKVKIENTI